MLELLKKNNPTQQNKDASDPAKAELARIRKRIALRASLTILTILMAVVIVFGMTAAWSTNVVHSGGLILQVEQTGVNVNAAIQADTFIAKPGDHGNICLSAVNNGIHPVDITISINKANMDLEMQKRLYFYVESQQIQNEEISQRSYVTADRGYTYQVLGGNSLLLTQTHHNNAQLKWCWVYDVLGYYVLGQENNGEVMVQEYLRPIEYNYDNATFDVFDQLETVDGIPVNTFLVELSSTDGYPGLINPGQMVGGYYKVDVDPNGYGVYAYLCTAQEVEAHTDYDTQLGVAALNGSIATYTALMTVHAQPAAYQSISVSSEEALLQALTAGDTRRIVLNSDMELSNGASLTLVAGTNVLLDLNGYTLITTSGGHAFTLEESASLTVTNGELDGSGSGGAFYTRGANLTLNDVTLLSYEKGVSIADYVSSGADSTIRLKDCTIDTPNYTIAIYGNGALSEQTSKLFIEGCTLTSDTYVIVGNGTLTGNGRWGTEIEISNSFLTQDTSDGDVGAAIFHPQRYGTLNIYRSVITGYTGIAIKGGSVTIDGSRIVGVGENPVEPTPTQSGFADTADAIYVETGYGYDISLTTRDTTAISYYSQGCRIFEEGSPYVTWVQEGTNDFRDKTGDVGGN